MIEETEVIETTIKRRRFFVLGPPTVMETFAYIVTGTVITDLIVYRTCLVSLNINATECDMLRNNASSPDAMILETEVEPYASVIVMANFLFKTILPAVLSLFLGPWSDRGGRRPILLATTAGTTLMYVILALMCNWNISPWYLLLASIPANIVGGTYTMKLAVVCHISDTTADKNRIRQMALLEVSTCVGTVLGGFTGPLIYNNYGYTSIFTIAAICSMLALIYTYLWIPETVENTSQESIRGIFKISSVKELVASFIVKREGFHRLVVWLAISAMTLNIMVYRGYSTIEFLFTRSRLGWDVRNHSYFDATDAVLRITGLCGISLRSRFSGASDTLLAGMSFTSTLAGAITKSLAWQSWHMYLSGCIGMLGGITLPAMRSIISKFVPAQDVGKVFTLLALLEILSSFGGPALYTLIYTRYLPPIYPSPVYLCSASFFAVSIFCVLCIEVLIRKSRKSPTYIAATQEDLES